MWRPKGAKPAQGVRSPTFIRFFFLNPNLFSISSFKILFLQFLVWRWLRSSRFTLVWYQSFQFQCPSIFSSPFSPPSLWVSHDALVLMAITLARLGCFVSGALIRHGRVSPSPGELTRKSPVLRWLYALVYFFEFSFFYWNLPHRLWWRRSLCKSLYKEA